MTPNPQTAPKRRKEPSPHGHALTAPRTAIRQRVQQLLADGLPAWDTRISSERVSVNRAIPLSPKKLPAVLIYTRDEKLDKDDHADPGLRRRVLELAVEVVGGGDDPQPDTTIDLLAAAAEAILDAHETLDRLVEGTRLSRVDSEISGEGDAVYVAARLLFEVTYWTRKLWLSADGLPEHMAEVIENHPDSPDARLIPGITDRLGDEPDVPRPTTVLTSFSPHIGIPHEPDYRPIGESFERPPPPCQGHD